MSKQNNIESSLKDSLGDDVEIHDTMDPDAVFITTKAKIELALRDYKQGVESSNAWENPATLFLTLLSVITVADFQKSFGLSADTLSSIYIVLTVISVVWLIKSIYTWYNHRKKSDIQQMIKDLKTENIQK